MAQPPASCGASHHVYLCHCHRPSCLLLRLCHHMTRSLPVARARSHRSCLSCRHRCWGDRGAHSGASASARGRPSACSVGGWAKAHQGRPELVTRRSAWRCSVHADAAAPNAAPQRLTRRCGGPRNAAACKSTSRRQTQSCSVQVDAAARSAAPQRASRLTCLPCPFHCPGSRHWQSRRHRPPRRCRGAGRQAQHARWT